MGELLEGANYWRKYGNLFILSFISSFIHFGCVIRRVKRFSYSKFYSLLKIRSQSLMVCILQLTSINNQQWAKPFSANGILSIDTGKFCVRSPVCEN